MPVLHNDLRRVRAPSSLPRTRRELLNEFTLLTLATQRSASDKRKRVALVPNHNIPCHTGADPNSLRTVWLHSEAIRTIRIVRPFVLQRSWQLPYWRRPQMTQSAPRKLAVSKRTDSFWSDRSRLSYSSTDSPARRIRRVA